SGSLGYRQVGIGGDRMGGSRPALRARAARAGAVVTAIAVVTVAMGGSAGAKKGSGSVPRMGGSITYGLEAETGGGWCLPQAQLAIPGIGGPAAVHDTPTIPTAKGPNLA